VGLAEDFEAALDEQPDDWSFFETYVVLDDPLRLTDARLALGRANARPVKGPGRVDFEMTVARNWGRGAPAGIVHSAMAHMDQLGITGHVWIGQTRADAMPAPAHRYGP
jgi:hypothetical protein